MKNVSRTGYKRNSPDKDNAYNVIPSGDITMKDVDFPVMGIDNEGNQQLMRPEEDYYFPGNTVLEFPMLKGNTLNKKNIYNRIFKK